LPRLKYDKTRDRPNNARDTFTKFAGANYDAEVTTIDTDTRTAIVTGSASGLGRAIALRLARDGWRIALADVDEASNRETLALVESRGGRGRIERLDVSDAAAWRRMVDGLRRDWQQLDLLVNNAGVAASAPVGELSLKDWNWVLQTNLNGAVYGCHEVVPWLKENPRGGHIVNIASVAAVMCAPDMAAYNTAKAGLVALSETLYSELQRHRIGVTVVCPGFVQTNILQRARYQSKEQESFAATAMRRSRLTADQLADRLMTAIRRKQLYLFVPFYTRWHWWGKRLAPQWYLNRIRRGFFGRFGGNRGESK
jgi:NAD(P)-dependent dehydrogenase (short-subunit alcohol dehydrogenase family)